MDREFDIKDLQKCIHNVVQMPNGPELLDRSTRQILDNQLQIMRALLKMLELKHFYS